MKMIASYRFLRQFSKGAVLLFILLSCFSLVSGIKAQIRTIYHSPEATLSMPELLRIFKPELATYSIQLHPGWLQKEEYDSLKHISVLYGLDPADTNHIFIKVISQHFTSRTIDPKSWTLLKANLRSNYGNRKIGTVELSDSIFAIKTDKGILARYELLAKLPDSYEYSATIITPSETLLLIADLSASDEATKKLYYFREIAANITETAK